MAIDPFNSNSNAPPKSSKYHTAELVVLGLLDIVSLPMVLLLRKDFGERFLRIFHAGFTSVTIWILWLIALGSAPFLLHHKDTILTWCYLLIVAVMASSHAIGIILRHQQGVIIHSRYTGYPRLMALTLLFPDVVKRLIKKWFGSLEVFTKIYVEFVFCLLAGAVLALIEPLLGMLIILGGFGIYAWGQYVKAAHEDRLLDIQDSRIEAQEMQNMLSGKPGSETQGFESYAPSVKVVSTSNKASSTTEDETKKDAPVPTDQLPAALAQLLNEDDEDDEDSEPRAQVAKVNVSSRKEEISTSARPRGRPRKSDVNAVY